MRLNRAGEIDYYEQLGVESTATPEQIHESFRALVRLLHPDQQRDAQLKSMAENQLRKINRIYAVLSDSERRRRYDEALEDQFRPPAVIFKPGVNVDPRQFLKRLVWIGAAVACVAIVIWIATDPPSGPVFSQPEHAIASAKAAANPASSPSSQPSEPEPSGPAIAGSQDETAQLRAALRFARKERDEARTEIAQLRAEQELADRHAATSVTTPITATGQSSALGTAAELSTTRMPPLAPHPGAATQIAAVSAPLRNPKLAGLDSHQFAGFWFFVRSSPPSRSKDLYPPEFIEATLTEQNGVVHGRYRSRYRIVDRAISPDVNFEFTGTPAGGVITCPWNGPGGAKGQLTLRLSGENDVKVDWTANEIGTIQGLASGTATLTRRLE